MSDIVLQLQNIEKAFDDQKVINGVSLEARRGEFITILGSSGCGKTTTLRIIAGMLMPDSGRVILNGQDVTDLPPNKRNVNTVFQNYALFPHMNVQKNIGYGLRIQRAPKREIEEKTLAMLKLVQMESYQKRMPDQLSGGQRQRVAIARAVILQPDVLLLDEPLGALDLKLRQQMQGELKTLQQQLGITFIYITHDQEEALNMSDRIAVMNHGQFEQLGSPAEIYECPKTRYVAKFIGQTGLIEGELIEKLDDYWRIKTQSGIMLAPDNSNAAKPGQKCAIAIHAERIHLGTPINGLPPIPATLVSKRYAGAMVNCELRLHSGQILNAVTSESLAALPNENEAVYWSFDPKSAALILGADQS